MPGWLFAVIVVVFVVVGVLVVRSTQRKRIVDRLPLGPDEQVLLEEAGLKVFHRFRKMAVRGGGTVTQRCASSSLTGASSWRRAGRRASTSS